MTPSQVIQAQVEAYNRKDLDAFLATYAEDAEQYILHGELLATIREEFEHNVTQQIYVSDKAWAQVRKAKEETLRIINVAFEQTGDNASGTALSQRVFETASRLSHLPTQEAVVALKEEVRRLF